MASISGTPASRRTAFPVSRPISTIRAPTGRTSAFSSPRITPRCRICTTSWSRSPRRHPPRSRDASMTPSDRNAASRAPFDLASQPLEEAAAKAASLFVSIYRGLEDRPVDPGVSRAAVRATFANTLTNEGVGLIRVLEEFENWVLPASMGTPHPLPRPGQLLATASGRARRSIHLLAQQQQVCAYHQSPAMTTCEEDDRTRVRTPLRHDQPRGHDRARGHVSRRSRQL